MKRFVFFFFAICVLASVWIGGNIAGVQQSAQNMVDSMYPARYDVNLANGTTLHGVSVRFDGDVAHLSNGDTIPVAGADFIGTDAAAHKVNSVRTGFLSMLLTSVMVAALVGITGFTTMLCIMAIRENERRRKAALRRARRAKHARVVAMYPEHYASRQAA